MTSNFKTFSIDKVFYASLKKYSQAIGTSLILVMSVMSLSFFMCGGLGLSLYGLYQLVLAYKVGAMPWTAVSVLKALLFASSAVVFCLGYGALLAGVARVSLDLYRTGSAKIGTLFSCFNNGAQVALAMLLMLSAVLCGLFLFIVPGLIICARAMLVLYFIVDQDMTAVEAIKASWSATRGNTLKILGVFFVCGLMSYSFYIVAIPLSWFIFAHIYTALSDYNSESTEEISQ